MSSIHSFPIMTTGSYFRPKPVLYPIKIVPFCPVKHVNNPPTPKPKNNELK